MTKQLGKAEVYELSFHTSRCLVMEIKVRASDQSTEVAAQSLADFLSQDGEFGALAIQVLTLLASKSEDIVMPMAEMTLPSTLVKTLFLFFDLPTPNSALRKVSWGRMHARLSKLLGSLAASPIVAKELVKAEDLSRLFDMLYSEVPAHNAMWRDISGVTLRSLFAKGMCDAAICDIRATGCVPRSLAALRHVKGFSAAAIANVLLTVRCTAASSFLSCSRVLPPPPPSVASYVSAIGSLLSLFLSFSRSLVLSFSRSLFFLFPSPLNADYKSVIRHDANMHMHMRMYNKGHLLCLRICKTVALASRRLPNVASDVIDNSPKPLAVR